MIPSSSLSPLHFDSQKSLCTTILASSHLLHKPSPTNPPLASHLQGEFEPGDRVTLKELTNASLNGLVGKVLKGTPETTSKGRIRVEITETKKTLSIQPKNMVNAEVHKKAAVVISLEKATPMSVWPMPPWDPEAKHARQYQGGQVSMG